MFDAKATFDRIRGERMTETGRACVDIAAARFSNDDPEGARAWLKVAFEGDKAAGDGRVKRALAKLDKKGRTRKKADQLADEQNNVVPMTGRGDAI